MFYNINVIANTQKKNCIWDLKHILTSNPLNAIAEWWLFKSSANNKGET